MADSDECMGETFVTAEWDLVAEDEDDDTVEELDVPLSQLRPVDADEETLQAVEDWHYWTERGYRLC